jgi:hypothetical protein
MYLNGNERLNRVTVLRYHLEKITIATEIPSLNYAVLSGTIRLDRSELLRYYQHALGSSRDKYRFQLRRYERYSQTVEERLGN